MENNKASKKKFNFPSAYTILIGLTIIIAIITNFAPGMIPAKINDVIMAPVTGMIGVKDATITNTMNDAMTNGGIAEALKTLTQTEGQYISVWNQGKVFGAIDVAFFVLIIGGFLGVVTKSGALNAGIASIVKKLKGRELLLIPILMIIFSIGGSTYGMAEESLAFYALLTTTMICAGFDPLVAVSTVLLGAGCGVLGSTINPFATGIASASAGVPVNQGIVLALGGLLWVGSLAVSIYFTMKYAKKIKEDPTKSLVSKFELDNALEAYSNDNEEIVELTKRRKFALIAFGITFVVMILGIIPWEDFGVTWFSEHTGILMGAPFGTWWFYEFAAWFLLMAVVIGIIAKMSEREIVSSFVAGASDMVGVALVIGISRGISCIMTNSGLDLYILNGACNLLNGVSGIIFVNLAYVIYIGLSFLIPSTSGLATVSMPIFAPLASNLGLAPELMIAAFSAGCGVVNLVTPTSAVVMGGLSIAKLEYSTWLKYVWKILLGIFIVCSVILSIAILIL